MGEWQQPFIGSAALVGGRLNRHSLRSRYRAVHPNIYVPRQSRVTLSQRITAAWLWSGGQAVVAGAAAASLHGTKWIDGNVPVELIHANPRAPDGVIVRRETLLDGEAQTLGELRVTVPERTAFDIGRHEPLRAGVAQLDALTRATNLQVADVATLAARHPGSVGCVNLNRPWTWLTPVQNHRGRLICGCCAPKLGWRRSAPRSWCPPTTSTITWTWAGRTAWSPLNTTANSTCSTDGSGSETSSGWRRWSGWAGSLSG